MSAAATPGSLYRVVWRWHFFAGLLVLPFLVMMAVTGGLYLFKAEIDHMVYRRWEDVPVRATPMLPAGAVIGRVEAAMDGEVLQFTPPPGPGQTVALVVRTRAGESRTAFADPYDGRLLGSTAYGGVMQLIRKIHSLQQFGFWASCLIEITAGWSIVLVLSGVWLWWPRGQKGGVLRVRGRPRERVFWRDLHAVTGVLAAGVILFLAVTGMPWSKVWGDTVQGWATSQGLGHPAPPAEVVPDWQIGMSMPASAMSAAAMSGMKPDLPWAMEKATAPSSGAAGGRTPIGVDRALASVRAAGLPAPFSLTLPSGPRGAYVAAHRPDRVEAARVVYVDQYDGHLLGQEGFAQYGPAAKVIEWGIAVHQGQEYGLANRYIMLAGCIAVLVLAVSSATMWWKRRPSGRLGVPPPPDDPKVGRGVLAIMIGTGLLFPLVGVSLAAALAVELVVRLTARTRSAA